MAEGERPGMNVLFHYDAGAALVQRLDALRADGLQVSTCAAQDSARFGSLLQTAQVLWHVLTPVSAQHIRDAPSLKLIQKIGVGVNTIDLDAAREHGVAVCNMPGTNSRAVAEMTLALMLSALRRLPFVDQQTRQGKGWALDSALQDDLGEIAGAVVGLVGFGAVPALLAPILTAMGAQVIYCANSAKDVPYARHDIDALLARSDIVSLHLPLDDDTHQLMNTARIARMKAGAVLINTARGALVDEQALVAALRGGHLRAAGLDVFAQEPVAVNNPLLQLPNVSVAPHLAWLTTATLQRSLLVAVDNCHRLQAGEALLHRVV
jgi:phosphoglycerate dehydrogenase-like enzyme